MTCATSMMLMAGSMATSSSKAKAGPSLRWRCAQDDSRVLDQRFHYAAIDLDRGTGNVRRALGGQKCDQVAELGGLAEAAQRNLLGALAAGLFKGDSLGGGTFLRQRRVPLGLKRARAYGVYENS